MKKVTGILVLIVGILLLLPLLGVTQLGSVTDGATAWIVAIVILVIGIMQLMKGK